MHQYRYLMWPMPLHWSAQEAAAALHMLEQLEQAIRQAYESELGQLDGSALNTQPTSRPRRKPNGPRQTRSRNRERRSVK